MRGAPINAAAEVMLIIFPDFRSIRQRTLTGWVKRYASIRGYTLTEWHSGIEYYFRLDQPNLFNSTNNQSIGYAFKMAKNKESRKDWLTPNVEGAEYLADEYGVHDLLIGDPSFKGGVGK